MLVFLAIATMPKIRPGTEIMVPYDKAIAANAERVERLRDNVRFLLAELAARGIVATTGSAIVPLVIGDEARAMAASAALEKAGFLVTAIRYPTVARGSARLRVALMSSHERADMTRAAEALARVLTVR